MLGSYVGLSLVGADTDTYPGNTVKQYEPFILNSVGNRSARTLKRSLVDPRSTN